MLDFFYPWNQSRQDQKLDHDMNQHKERREYYRIQDTLALEFQSVPKEQALAQTPVMPFTLDPRFQVLHALHELDMSHMPPCGRSAMQTAIWAAICAPSTARSN